MTTDRQLSIVGSRGIPARHGGFETFAEKLALYLTAKGWDVNVYCQIDGPGKTSQEDWNGITRILIPTTAQGALGTIIFDWKSTWHAAQSSRLVLVLGYNTAIFSLLYRLRGIPNIINMDGLEWQREKWNWLERAWLYFNDRCARYLANHLIADHPEIESYLAEHTRRDKITMIPYGADVINEADCDLIKTLELTPKGYGLVIARLEPENSIMVIVKAWSASKRGQALIVLGDFEPDLNPFHQELRQAASPEIRFVGAIYDQATVRALRYFTNVYIHGHTVGGTNPSLVEALGAGAPVLAHDNRFNRWVCGESADFFKSDLDLLSLLAQLSKKRELLEEQAEAILKRQRLQFCWDEILADYERCLEGLGVGVKS